MPNRDLDLVRAKIAAALSARAELDYLPANARERELAVCRAVDGLAEIFRDDLPNFTHVRSPSDLNFDRTLPTHLKQDAQRMLCYFFGDRIKERLCAHAKSAESGPTVAEVEERRTDLTAELRALEIEEERLIRQLEADGLEVLRRPDASPDIVLMPDL